MRLDINNIQYQPGTDPVNLLLVHEYGNHMYLILSQAALQARAVARGAFEWSDSDILAEAQVVFDSGVDANLLKFAGYTLTYPVVAT